MPLIVEGVRQCGKTYILKEFGSKNYTDVAYFNFEENPQLFQHFEQDLDPFRIIEELGGIAQRMIIPEKTLIIFDEVQFCGRALTSLKYFCEKASGYHVVCAGSLLGVLLSKPQSFPVGNVNRIRMHPMNFHEFLLANGESPLCKHLDGLGPLNRVPETMVARLSSYLRSYYIVGGMPRIVDAWVSSKDLEVVDRLQENILNDFIQDFGKHATKDINELMLIWRSIYLSSCPRRTSVSYSTALRPVPGRRTLKTQWSG